MHNHPPILLKTSSYLSGSDMLPADFTSARTLTKHQSLSLEPMVALLCLENDPMQMAQYCVYVQQHPKLVRNVVKSNNIEAAFYYCRMHKDRDAPMKSMLLNRLLQRKGGIVSFMKEHGINDDMRQMILESGQLHTVCQYLADVDAQDPQFCDFRDSWVDENTPKIVKKSKQTKGYNLESKPVTRTTSRAIAG